jgi:FKBP-type peptidyl-prolyl cis-trans isomerase (trigger factor)
VGDVKNIDNIFNVFKGDKSGIAKNILHKSEMTAEELETMNARFSCRVDRIARIIPAEMNELFFSSVSQELGSVASEEEVRSAIIKNIEAYNDAMTEVSLENEIYKFLAETTDIPLPEVFLRKWFDRTREKESENADPEKEFDLFKSQLKQSLIYRKVQQEHNLQVDKDEIIAEAVSAVRMSYGQLGEDFVRYVTESQLKDKSFVENMHDRVMQKKFFTALKSYVNVEEKNTTLEEYQKLTKNEEVYAE